MLDDVPVASIVFIASIVLIIIGYAMDDINIEESFKALAAAGIGSFGVGYVRNQAGRGVRK